MTDSRLSVPHRPEHIEKSIAVIFSDPFDEEIPHLLADS